MATWLAIALLVVAATCIALVLNTMMILGVMAGINTTLTLPGIAGFDPRHPARSAQSKH